MLMDSDIFTILYKLIYFSLPLNPEIQRMRNATNILCFDVKNKKVLNNNLYDTFALSYPFLLLMTHHEETRLNAKRSPNPNPAGGTKVQ